MTPSDITDYFTRLGLTAEIAELYLTLYSHGPQTISELSRNSGIERTRIYRQLKGLRSTGLIEVESRYKHSLISAAPIANLRILIDQKHANLEKLQTDLTKIQQALTPNPVTSPTTKVKYYQGPQGLRQILWNELRAANEIQAYSYQILDEGVGRPFMHNWTAEFERRGLHKKILFNDTYVDSWQNRPGRRIKGMEYNYIEPAILATGHTCNVYNDVVCYLNWNDGEVFGVEIYNRDIADIQRQLLKLAWPLSRPETRF